jgi:hypothetical protein
MLCRRSILLDATFPVPLDGAPVDEIDPSHAKCRQLLDEAPSDGLDGDFGERSALLPLPRDRFSGLLFSALLFVTDDERFDGVPNDRF